MARSWKDAGTSDPVHEGNGFLVDVLVLLLLLLLVILIEYQTTAVFLCVLPISRGSCFPAGLKPEHRKREEVRREYQTTAVFLCVLPISRGSCFPAGLKPEQTETG